MADFGRPITLEAAAPGLWRGSCRLEPGTYAYKLCLPCNEWVLDPGNPRTRGSSAGPNSLLVVDGADEPLLHAPAPPWVGLEDDGRLVVRAGLRRGAGEGLSLLWDEGHGERRAAMTPLAVESEHLLFEALLPASSAAVEYLFVLPDGRPIGAPGGAAQAFRVDLDRVRHELPAWWKEAVLYTVFVDRWRRGGAGGRWPDPGPGAREDGRRGGDLAGVIEGLDHVEGLGATAIHLTPIALSPSAHRYEATDPRRVDPALGDEATLDRLLDEAHRRGMRVLLDVTVTHVHESFFAFRDVARLGPASRYWRWFHATRFPFGRGVDPGYLHYQKGQWQEPLLALEEPEVQDYVVGTFEEWARRGVDGFRVDAAADIPLELLGRIAAAVRALSPEALVYGEVIPAHVHRYLAQGIDAATDFAAQEILLDWVARGRRDGPSARDGLVARRFDRAGPGSRAIAFTATHDQHRLLTVTGDPRRARLAALLVLVGEATPAIYYGDEVGLSAPEASRAFEGAWPDRQPMVWDPSGWDLETLALHRAAIRARRGHAALARGDLLPLEALRDDDGTEARAVLAFRRVGGGEVVDVLLNGGGEALALRLPGGAPSGARALVMAGQVAVEPDAGRVVLGPWSGAALLRETPAEAALAFAELVASAPELSLAAFRAGETRPLALPQRLYLTVTEACNIRCEHCLTFAPEATRSGRARELRPWVLEALAEAMAAARYVGFSHGGESLASAMLPPTLAAIRRARAGRPGRTDVHLLTNGMLLTASTVEELLDLGVTSLAVSLDGASPATNDALRRGSRLERVVDNVRSAVALRERRGADLRIGISTVVGRHDLHELPALGELAVDLGVDWLKVEEMFPATPRARAEMVLPRDRRLLDGMAELRAALEGSPVVLVDHLDPPEGCWCEARRSRLLEAFRRADDFANRARFNPCRMAWEQACVDPDGTVHLGDYFAPPIGNLLEASFLDLWMSDRAAAERRAALGRVPASRRQTCAG